MVTAEKITVYENWEEQKPAIRITTTKKVKKELKYQTLFLYTACFFVVLVVILSYLDHYAVVTRNNLKIAKLAEIKNQLLREEETIDIETAKLASYANIMRIAQTELGMGEAKNVQFLHATDQEGSNTYTAKNTKAKNKNNNPHKNLGLKNLLMGFHLKSTVN